MSARGHTIHAVLTDNGIQFTNRACDTYASRHIFDRVCDENGIKHHLTKVKHPWLAIDPHGLLGERTFDCANIFTNPDLSDPSRPLATLPGQLEGRLEVVVAATRIEPERLLSWIIAWTGLSAAWFIGDGDDKGAAIDLTINSEARRLLG